MNEISEGGSSASRQPEVGRHVLADLHQRFEALRAEAVQDACEWKDSAQRSRYGGMAQAFRIAAEMVDAARAAECDCPVSSGEGAWREAHDPTCPAATSTEEADHG